MKPRKLLICLVALLFAIPLAAAKSHAEIWQVVSSITFTRGTGIPVTETFDFSALGGTATFYLTNGDLVDGTAEKVSSSVIALNGAVICGPSEFNQNVTSIQKEIALQEGENTIAVTLMGKPGGQVTIQIQADAAEITPEISIVQTANALRTGNIQFAASFFTRSSKDEVLMNLDRKGQNLLADWLQNADLINEKEGYRAYRTQWIDEQGNTHNMEFIMIKNESGQWEIISW